MRVGAGGGGGRRGRSGLRGRRDGARGGAGRGVGAWERGRGEGRGAADRRVLGEFVQHRLCHLRGSRQAVGSSAFWKAISAALAPRSALFIV